ncbi:hypothetical protein [Paenibacillus durus]|uniref:Uncharacterized protein n=1 Tax=Paenibacillus durus TaxID=44251 RepID=A0A089IY06_PAEDU|nr:hypothetical protein [Paenibacillus durus]AIQ13834.1 hypothetical protein PDUR_19375 [Paenibacillus durus]
MSIKIKSLFSELNGFVVYEPAVLKKYLENNVLLESDVLQYFTETDHGEIITKNGIAIPIIGVNTGYYNFNVVFDEDSLELKKEEIKARSSGWIYYTYSEKLCIVGIGFFKNIDSINSNNSLTFNIDNGWYSVDILCGEKEDHEELMFELLLKREETTPTFFGDFETEYYF